MTYALVRPARLDLDAFARATGCHPELICRLVTLGILDAVTTFPGAIGDLDLVLTSAESPCVRNKWAHGAVPVPLFGRTGSRRHRDVP